MIDLKIAICREYFLQLLSSVSQALLKTTILRVPKQEDLFYLEELVATISSIDQTFLFEKYFCTSSEVRNVYELWSIF